MYKLSRLMLILSAAAGIWSVLIFALQLGGLGYIAIAVVLVALYVKRGSGRLSAFGTARWANADDLRAAGMLDAKSGLIIGRVMGGGKPLFRTALQELFSSWVSSKEACEQFLASVRLRRKAMPHSPPAS